jgi:hypothetical protein
MRARKTVEAILLAVGALLCGAVALGAAEVTRTLKVELSGADLANFSVENLAGTMRVLAGEDGAVVVVATVHAETQALADGVRLERVAGEGGAAALRVRYPENVSRIRYRPPVDDDTVQISLEFLSFSSSTYHYDGRTYRVSPGHGKRLWADLEVRVPAHVARARFQNLAGLVEAESVEGGLRFDVASADLRLRHLAGEIAANGSSGDTHASEIRGRWESHFSSGDCLLDHFDGDSVSFRTSSGDVHASGLRARLARTQTSSGDVLLRQADLEEFRGDASSGDLVVEAEDDRLKVFNAETSSGDVVLRLPAGAAFDAAAEQSSGDMKVTFSGGTETRRRDKLVAYRRGTGGTRIRVDTSSGDLVISPR